jgi:hypothetical protein
MRRQGLKKRVFRKRNNYLWYERLSSLFHLKPAVWVKNGEEKKKSLPAHEHLMGSFQRGDFEPQQLSPEGTNESYLRDDIR